ncbi:MAG: glycosyltransferase family 39 protein [Anaerolineae bacterium]
MIETDRSDRQFPRLEFPEALALVAVLFLAALLRAHLIGAQSLWADEGNSWAMAIRPLGAIAEAVSGDVHPPLYYYLLNLWVRLAGTSETALRSLSALSGWLLVAATYLWGRRVFGPVAGLVAGLCAAVSPFAVYYSQEARAYALMTLLATLCALTFTCHVQARDAGRRGSVSLILYSLCGAALLWTHYLGGGVLLLINLFALVWIAGRSGPLSRRRRLLEWALAQVAVAALYAPWLPVMLRTAGEWPAISEPRALGYYLREAARLYTSGPAGVGLRLPSLLAVAVAAVGAVAGWLRRRHGLTWTLVVALAAWAPLVMWLMALVRPAYRAKFMLLGLPAFHLLLAAAVVGVVSLLYRLLSGRGSLHWRGAVPAALVAGLLLVPTGLASYTGLRAVYYDSRYARDDYRAIAGFLDAAAGAEDAVILNAPGQVEVFSYYYHGPARVYPLPLQRPAGREAIIASLEDIARQSRRAYAVLWATGESDPQSHVETWLSANAYKAMDSWYGNVRLAAYELPSAAITGHNTDLIFGEVAALDAVAVGTDSVSPGAAWPVELHWHLLQPAGGNYKVFLQALDANSNIIGQRDAELLADGRPTGAWSVGEAVVDRQAVPVYVGTPPGRYRVVAGLYDAGSGARLLLPDGSDHLELGQVEVTAAPRPVPLDAIRPLVKARINLGTVRLLGWDAGALGGTAARSIEAAPGQPLSVVLYWTILQQQDVGLGFALQAGATTEAAGTQALLQGYGSSAAWQVDSLVRDPHIIFVPANVAPGGYRLTMTVTTAEGEGTVDLATVTVTGPQ